MAKTKEKKGRVYTSFFNRILKPLFSSVEENAEDLLEKVTDFAFLKSTFKKYMIFFIFATAAFVMVLYGLGLLINTYLPAIELWMVYILLGAVTYLIGLIYLKTR